MPVKVALTAKVDPLLSERVDAARGPLSRSAWLEMAVLAFLEYGGSVPVQESDPGAAVRLWRVQRGTPELIGRLREAQSRPLPVRCPHRRRGIYCTICRCVCDPDGMPVRVP